jgi:hypothetical protein
MRASHKTRLARLLATMPPPDEAERREVDCRSMLRFDAVLCAVIRRAMERRGIDPARAAALREYEANVADFVDTPELQAADAAFCAAHRDDEDEEIGEEDPRAELMAMLNRIARRFMDGSSPDFARCSFSELLAWAIAQDRLNREAARASSPAPPDEGYGVSVRTS